MVECETQGKKDNFRSGDQKFENFRTLNVRLNEGVRTESGSARCQMQKV